MASFFLGGSRGQKKLLCTNGMLPRARWRVLLHLWSHFVSSCCESEASAHLSLFRLFGSHDVISIFTCSDRFFFLWRRRGPGFILAYRRACAHPGPSNCPTFQSQAALNLSEPLPFNRWLHGLLDCRTSCSLFLNVLIRRIPSVAHARIHTHRPSSHTPFESRLLTGQRGVLGFINKTTTPPPWSQWSGTCFASVLTLSPALGVDAQKASR